MNRTAHLGGYIEYAPPPATRDFVDALWLHRTHAPATQDHLVIPEPRVSLAYFRDGVADGQSTNGQLAIIGPVTKPRPLPPRVGHEIIAVRIRLEAAADILGSAPSEHLDAIDVVGHLAKYRNLLDRLAGEPNSIAILGMLREWVTRRIREARELQGPFTDIRLKQAVALICRRTIPCRISDVADSCGLSVRHMRRLAQSLYGLGPKEMARFLRVEQAVLAADNAGQPQWADIACAAGFADQAHMIRECRQLTGQTPKALFSWRRREPITPDPMASCELVVAAPYGERTTA